MRNVAKNIILICLIGGFCIAENLPGELNRRLVEKSVKAIADQYEIPEEDITIEIIHPPKLTEVNLSDNDWVVKLKNRELRLGFQILWIVGSDMQGNRFEFPMSVQVGIDLPICVAKQTIARDETISLVNVEKKVVHLKKGRYESLAVPEKILGLTARQLIRSGAIIRSNMVQVAPPVRRGDHVAITMDRGALQIKLNGILQNDAWIGEQVRVLAAETGKVLNGTLIDPNRVMIK